MYQFQQHINLVQNKLYFVHLSLTPKREHDSLEEEVRYFLQNKNGTYPTKVQQSHTFKLK